LVVFKVSSWLVGIILAFNVATASATLIEVSMSGHVPIPPFSSTGTIPTLGVGSTVVTSFVLDTGSVGSSQMTFGTFSGNGFPAQPVLSDFDIANVLTRDITLVIDGVNAAPAPGTLGATGYDGLLSSPPNGTDYDLFMTVVAPGLLFRFQDFNVSPQGAITQSAVLGAVDPLAFLLHSYGTTPAFAFLTGDYGRIAFAVDALLIRDVPEPGTLALFAAAALGALALGRRRMQQRR
jgi:hypothetical protein